MSDLSYQDYERQLLARFPEGESVNVPDYLREHGNPEAAEKWEEMNEEHGDKFKNANAELVQAAGVPSEDKLRATLDDIVRGVRGLDWYTINASTIVFEYQNRSIARLTREGSRWIIRYRSASNTVMTYPVRTLKEVKDWVVSEATSLAKMASDDEAPGFLSTAAQEYLSKQGAGSENVAVAGLPAFIKAALKAARFTRRQIPVYTQNQYMMAYPADDGARGFTIIANLDTRQVQVHEGNWGGGGLGVKDNPVDNDDTRRPIPDNVAIIQGQYGSSSWASIMVTDAGKAKLLSAARLAGEETDEEAKFEEGKPADPTENMSPEDAKKWREENERNKDKFKSAAWDPADWPRALEAHILDNPLPLGDRWDIVRMSGDEFKVECRESVMYLHAKTYYVGEAVVSVIGKDTQGKTFKRQFHTDDKLVPNLLKLLDKAKPGGGKRAGHDLSASMDELEDLLAGFKDNGFSKSQMIKDAKKDLDAFKKDILTFAKDVDADVPSIERVLKGMDAPDLERVIKKLGSTEPERIRTSWTREAAHDIEAAGGLYGFTQGDQRDVEASIRKLQRHAARVAETAWQKDDRVVAFLTTHVKRANSSSARILLSALQSVGPKVASQNTDQGKVAYTPSPRRLEETKKLILEYARRGRPFSLQEVYEDSSDPADLDLYYAFRELVNEGVLKGPDPFRAPGNHSDWVYRTGSGEPLATPLPKPDMARLASADFGMYGFRAKTARLGLDICADIREAAGRIAYGLHARRTARYANITGFLKEHSKQAKCGVSKMLLACYPDAPTTKSAGAKEAGGSGAANAEYLDGLSSQMRNKILKNVADHYGVSIPEMERELKDRDAEALYEYITNDNALRMQVYNDLKGRRASAPSSVSDWIAWED